VCQGLEGMPLFRCEFHNSLIDGSLDTRENGSHELLTIIHLKDRLTLFGFTTLNCGVLPKVRDFPFMVDAHVFFCT
jgi:hypothetical protein